LSIKYHFAGILSVQTLNFFFATLRMVIHTENVTAYCCTQWCNFLRVFL